MSAAVQAGGSDLLPATALPRHLENHYVERASQLPEATRQLLLLAAAEPLGDATLIWRAAETLGIESSSLAPAEDAQLVEVGTRVRFRHPLVRSAVYRGASVSERRTAHRALAEATVPESDPDRRAWHRAQAAVGVDEAAAAELERSADRARARGGAAAAAAFLAYATELTPEPQERGTRALAAAQAKFDAAAADAALELLATAELTPLDDFGRAWLERLRAEIEFARTRGSDAPALLLDAARRLEPLDAAMARETHLEAIAAAIFAGHLGTGSGVRGAAEAAQAAPAAEEPRALDVLLDGLATRFTDGYAAGLPRLRAALEQLRDAEALTEADVRWLWLGCRLAQDLWDDELWLSLATRGVEVARKTGALSVLPTAATYGAALHVHAGEFAAAAELIDEADVITQATGIAPLKYAAIVLAAWRGYETKALELFEAARTEGTARGEGMGLRVLEWATALLYNGCGRYGEALEAARQPAIRMTSGYSGGRLVELIEAGVRSGATDAAAAALDPDRADAGERDRLGPRRRVRLTRAAERRARCGAALPRVGRAARPHARRDPRRARPAPVRGVAPSREPALRRARAAPLAATGETARRRTDDARGVLTPQEAHIARLAKDGLSNSEIGAQLFISPRTVQYHLRKMFLKLEISSRNQLSRVPASQLRPA